MEKKSGRGPSIGSSRRREKAVDEEEKTVAVRGGAANWSDAGGQIESLVWGNRQKHPRLPSAMAENAGGIGYSFFEGGFQEGRRGGKPSDKRQGVPPAELQRFEDEYRGEDPK